MRVLVVNCGSTTLKHSVIRVEVGGVVHDEDEPVTTTLPIGGVGAVLPDIVQSALPDAVGHRVVHGGPRHAEPEVVTAALLDDLRSIIALAPLHLPSSIEAMAALPGEVNVACFDTAFHAVMPESATRFPLARRWFDEGIRRYGFHGLACESVVDQLRATGRDLPTRLVIAHLGGGASLTAVLDGRSVRTSMGLTPTGGIPGATRPGDLDPGVVLELARRLGSVDDAEREVTLRSGLAGWSGLGGDVHSLEDQRAAGEPDAAFALDAFAAEIARGIAAHAVTLGGLDALAFSGGVGEHDDRLVDDVVGRLAGVIDVPVVHRIGVREDHVIARAASALLTDRR